jgi:hypothetical protein
MRPRTLAATLTLALALPLAAQTAPATANPTVAAPKTVPLISPPYSQNPILQLKGNARALLIFAPDTTNAALRQQMQLLHGHDLQLSKLNTVFVPLVTLAHGPSDVVFGENIHPGNYRDQLSARRKFGIKYNQFAVILLDKDGTETFRSTTPVTMSSITNAIDSTPSGAAGASE